MTTKSRVQVSTLAKTEIPMHRLIYVSRSTVRFPPDLTVILESSQRNNAKSGITGALCFLDGTYCQYLEGDRTALEDLYRILLLDQRHKDVMLIESCSITNRLFTTWSMALVSWNKQTRSLFKALNAIDTADLYAITTINAAVSFDLLAQSSNWTELTPHTKL